jgi:dihydrofolate reductase
MSLDGYIAGPKGETDWIVMDPEIDFKSFMGSFDTLLIGRKTFEAARKQHKGGGGMPGMTSIVFSRTLKPKDCTGATLSEDPKSTIAELKSKPGKDIWLFGGGELFGNLLGLGLVDRIEVGVIPILLGSGIPLLPETKKRARLKLTSHRTYAKTGTAWLEYDVT